MRKVTPLAGNEVEAQRLSSWLHYEVLDQRSEPKQAGSRVHVLALHQFHLKIVVM